MKSYGHGVKIYTLGNLNLLDTRKIAFFCSHQCPPENVIKCFDWANHVKDGTDTIISGFHTPIEKDVLKILLRGNCPIISVLARGLKKKLESELQKAIEQKRLLIITPFPEKVKRITEETAIRRNQMIAELADEILVGYSLLNGNLEKLVTSIRPFRSIRYIT